MDCSQAVLTLFLLVPCDQGGGHSGDPAMDLAITEALAAPERGAFESAAKSADEFAGPFPIPRRASRPAEAHEHLGGDGRTLFEHATNADAQVRSC
mgnify:CR=1 FL=1